MCPETFEAYRCCFGGSAFPRKPINPKHFMHCCHRHGLLASLYQKTQGQGWLDPAIESKLAEAYRDQFFNYAVYQDLLEKLHAALQTAQLQVVLLKGVALWLERYSPPMLRHVSDIDILVLPGQRALVIQLLEELGLAGDSEGKSFKDARDRRVDLHDGKLGIIEENSGITVGEILRTCRPAPNYPQFLLMGTELETTYLAIHAMKHSYLRFIWLNDIALCASQAGAAEPDRLARKALSWALYLHEYLLSGDAASRHGLNAIEAYLARRMLVVDQHPLGKILVALYQPTPAKAWRCLVEGARRDGDRQEPLTRRLLRLFREALASFS